MPTLWRSEREAVADAARRMAGLGLVSGTAGNVSVRWTRMIRGGG